MALEDRYKPSTASTISEGLQKKKIGGGKRHGRSKKEKVTMDIPTVNEGLAKKIMKVVRQRGRLEVITKSGHIVEFEEPVAIVARPGLLGTRRAPFVQPRRVLAPGVAPKPPAPKDPPKDS